MMLIHRLDITTYCSKIFEKQERSKCSISCPPFPHISMILNINRIWYFSQNKQQDEELSSWRIPKSFSWLQKLKLASPSSERCSLSCSSSLSSPQVPQPDENGYRKSLYSDRVHSWRFNKSTRAPAPPLLAISWDLLGHHGRDPGHDNTDLAERSASHSHVPFSQYSVLRGSLLLLYHYP